jgi:2-polyprenyl-3-methyl-5-hydroxy-6-metoxy-1,4-benzoquinol methylase
MRDCEICKSKNVVVLLDNLSFSSVVDNEPAEWNYQLLKCRNCGLGFVDPKPSWKRLSSFYDESYGSYTNIDIDSFAGRNSIRYRMLKYRYAQYASSGLGAMLQNALGAAVEWATGRTVAYSLGIPLQLPKDARIFDFGYGQGNWLLSMSRLGYTRLSGYDIDANEGNSARLVAQGIEVSGGDFLENTYKNSSFDCIHMGHVLEHLLWPHEVLAECYRILKPGGILVLGSPCIDSWVAKLSLKDFPGLQLPWHLFHYTPKSAKMLLESAGFHVGKAKPYGAPQHLPIVVNALLRDRGFRRFRFPSFMFIPVLPFYKLLCILTRKGECLTMLCEKPLK